MVHVQKQFCSKEVVPVVKKNDCTPKLVFLERFTTRVLLRIKCHTVTWESADLCLSSIVPSSPFSWIVSVWSLSHHTRLLQNMYCTIGPHHHPWAGNQICMIPKLRGMGGAASSTSPQLQPLRTWSYFGKFYKSILERFWHHCCLPVASLKTHAHGCYCFDFMRRVADATRLTGSQR